MLTHLLGSYVIKIHKVIHSEQFMPLSFQEHIKEFSLMYNTGYVTGVKLDENFIQMKSPSR